MIKQEIIQLWASLDISQEDVFLIIQKFLNISSKELFLLDKIDQKYIPEIEEALQQKHIGVPLEHILWEANFYGYRFLLWYCF